MQIKRANRVAEVLKHEISKIILENVKDPNINFVTISHIELSDDLKYAKIFYTVLADKVKREKANQALQKATKFIRKEIAKNVKLRHIPELKFFYDPIADQIDNIENLFQKIKNEDAQ